MQARLPTLVRSRVIRARARYQIFTSFIRARTRTRRESVRALLFRRLSRRLGDDGSIRFHADGKYRVFITVQPAVDFDATIRPRTIGHYRHCDDKIGTAIRKRIKMKKEADEGNAKEKEKKRPFGRTSAGLFTHPVVAYKIERSRRRLIGPGTGVERKMNLIFRLIAQRRREKSNTPALVTVMAI